MGIKTVIDYTNPLNHTASAGAEVSGGFGRLKSLAPAGELAFFNFATDENPVRGAGDVTLTGSSVAGGKLDIGSGTQSRAIMENMGISPRSGTIHFKFTPNFSGIGATKELLRIYDSANTSQNILYMQLQNQGGGISRVWIYVVDSAGVTQIASIMTTLSFVASQEYDFKLSYDFVTGNTRFFLDGVQVYTSVATVAMVTNPTHNLSFGGLGAGVSDFKLDDLQVISVATEVDATGFAVPVEEAFTYSADCETLETNSAMTLNSFDSFTAIESIPVNTSLTYILKLNSIKYYWDGANWSVSDGTMAQSNTAAVIEANKATLPVGGGASLKLIAVLCTTDRYITPKVDTNEIGYGFFYSPTDLNTCIVYGVVKDNYGNPIEGAKITVDGDDFLYNDNVISRSAVYYTLADGKFEMPIVETATFSKTVDITIEYSQNRKKKKLELLSKTIPNMPTASIDSL